MDSISFDAKAKSGVLTYAEGECSVRVRAGSGRATVQQQGRCGEDFGLVVSAGKYERHRRYLDEDDCSPRGS
jgi:hypothetical protein